MSKQGSKKKKRVASPARTKTSARRAASARKPSRARTPKKVTPKRTAPKKSLQKKATVSRAAAPARSAKFEIKPGARPQPLPMPLATRHVATPRPVPVAPARSMPPTRDQIRRPVLASPRPPMPLPEFSEAGILLAITYSIREGRRQEFFDLMRELKPLLNGIGGTDCTIYEDRSRPSYFMEVFRFKDEAEFTAFDDKFHKDRKVAAIYALLDDIVEAEKSDFKIFERRL